MNSLQVLIPHAIWLSIFLFLSIVFSSRNINGEKKVIKTFKLSILIAPILLFLVSVFAFSMNGVNTHNMELEATGAFGSIVGTSIPIAFMFSIKKNVYFFFFYPLFLIASIAFGIVYFSNNMAAAIPMFLFSLAGGAFILFISIGAIYQTVKV